jgi:flagellar hook-associated protein FlgK
MPNFSIGLSGLEVSQRLIDLTGTNIANAATEGYHRQEAVVCPVRFNALDTRVPTGGVEVKYVRRNMDILLELEMIRQRPQLGQVSQELDTLQAVESSLGDLETGGLAKSLNEFFAALTELAANPTTQAYQEQVAWTGENVAMQFQSFTRSVTRLQENILDQAQELAEDANALITEIADLNGEVRSVASKGGNTNMLEDRRDEAINQLAELIDIEVFQFGQHSGMVDVHAWGMPLVIGARPTLIEVGITEGGNLGVSMAGAEFYSAEVSGGRIGGLAALRNDILPDFQADLDALAESIIDEINALQVQGIGVNGSFTDLAGWPVYAGAFDTWTDDIAAGTIHVRITAPDGTITREQVTIDPAVDTVATVAAAFDGLTGLNATADGNRLRIYSDAGYTYDFLPAVLPYPDTSGITGTAVPTASGIYGGAVNQDYTFTVVGSGDVGTTSGLFVEVRNGVGDLVTTLNVGAGYGTGDAVEVEDGLHVAFGPGSLNNGDAFVVPVLADADETSALSVLGINTFFKGNSAATIGVTERILSSPGSIGTAAGSDGVDNTFAARMADLAETKLADLNNASVNDFFHRLVGDIGQSVTTRKARKGALENVRNQLIIQRDSVSGVDVNEEAANLMAFERMFQAVSKFISIQDSVIDYLMQLI